MSDVVFTARVKRLTNSKYRVGLDSQLEHSKWSFHCGRPHPCNGLLAYATTDIDMMQENRGLALAERVRWLAGSFPHHDDLRFPEVDGFLRFPWVLAHPWGLRRDGALYRVMEPVRNRDTGRLERRRRGRRATPLEFVEQLVESELTPAEKDVPAEQYDAQIRELLQEFGHDFEVLGEFPRFPAVIVCPKCRRPNRVEEPTDIEDGVYKPLRPVP